MLLCSCKTPAPSQDGNQPAAATEAVPPASADLAVEFSVSEEPVTAKPRPAETPSPSPDSETPSPEPVPSEKPEETAEPVPSPEEAEPLPDLREPQKIVEEMVVTYGLYENAAWNRITELLFELENTDPDAAGRWAQIMELWRSIRSETELNYKVLPDGLPNTNELAIVTLGYKLNANGTIRKELIGRLTVTLRSAKKYPKAYLICTGGGTASKKENATEAGQMSSWLKKKGISKKRIITEKKSHTTAQNAMYTYDILEKKYPDINAIAIVTSDYHIASGILLFQAEAILRAEAGQTPRYTVVSHAAYDAEGSLSLLSQAAALLELTGDSDTAFDVYHGRYDYSIIPAPENIPEETIAPDPSVAE